MCMRINRPSWRKVTINHMMAVADITGIKGFIEFKEGIPYNQQILRFEVKLLQNGTVRDYKIGS